MTGKARSRKPEVSRVTSLRRKRDPRRSTSCRADGVSGGRGLRKCIPGKFQPATLDTRDRGFTRSSTISSMLIYHLATHSATNFGQQFDIQGITLVLFHLILPSEIVIGIELRRSIRDAITAGHQWEREIVSVVHVLRSRTARLRGRLQTEDRTPTDDSRHDGGWWTAGSGGR